jgi:glycosyltransferase involved in cell wall biosynthesis
MHKYFFSCVYLLIFSLFQHVACAYEEKPIVVVIPSYNNEKWVEKNLASVLTQKYQNFKVIYIDDCSTDNTYKLALDVVEKYEQQQRITVLHNKERYGALANLYMAIHECPDNSIIVTVDGDDWLAHENVFAYLNKVYSEKDIWLTYGQFLIYPTNEFCSSYSMEFSEDVIAKNAFRKTGNLPMSHLRTFYAWLFKSIKLNDMLCQGNFYSMSWDKTIMAPMIEMAAWHHYCVPEVLYIYNADNPISDHQINYWWQYTLARHVLKLPAYEQLTCPKNIDALQDRDKVSVVLLCQQAPQSATIMSCMKNIDALRELYVVSPNNFAVPSLSQEYNNVHFVTYTASDLIGKLQECLNSNDDAYVFLCTEVTSNCPAFDLLFPMRAMKHAQVDLFYCALGKNSHSRNFSKNLPLIDRRNAIYAWYAQDKIDSWRIPVCDMTLWSKDVLSELLSQCEAKTIADLIIQLEAKLQAGNRLGLMLAESLIAIPCTQGSGITLKCHEQWWENNVERMMQTFAGWLGDISSPSRVQARTHIRKKNYTSVLDIPCSLATDFWGFQQDGTSIDYLGIDITPKLIKLVQDKNVPVRQGSIEDIPCKDSSYDVCYVRHMLEHLSYYEKAIAELIRVARQEVLVIFFIKPGAASDKIYSSSEMGSLLYHNYYNRQKFENYVLSHKKVTSCEWEDVNENEVMLHIYLK